MRSTEQDRLAQQRKDASGTLNRVSTSLRANLSAKSPFKPRAALMLATVAVLALTIPQRAFAVTPESPEVKQVIEKALVFLEKEEEERLGGKCLQAMCFLKNGRPVTHPKVEAAVKACQASDVKSEDVYSNGLAIIFLCELDPQLHRALIQKHLTGLLAKQKRHGGWGYEGQETGDTSQVQYAALGIWMAGRHGFQVPLDTTERLAGWLMRTQDPSGAWGYQGNDPGNYQQRVQQSEIRPSLVAAGLGSVYISADLLGISDIKERQPETGLPPALRVVGDDAKKVQRGGISKVIDATRLRKTMADGNAWFAKNYTLDSAEWTHYYFYGLERYHSYRELVEGTSEREPRWYNDIFALLKRTQQASGSWNGGDNEVVATCFSVLFLVRSSRKAIQKIADLGEGVLLGGMGLPPSTADLQERNGQIVETPLGGTVDELIAILNNPDSPEFDQLSNSPGAVSLDSDVTRRSGQIAKLRALVSAGAFQSRLVAVRTLGRVRDFDNVPFLLYALTDPDVRVVLEADKGLRFISRKFDGVGLPPEPSPTEIRAAQTEWKEWFLSVRPDAELLE